MWLRKNRTMSTATTSKKPHWASDTSNPLPTREDRVLVEELVLRCLQTPPEQWKQERDTDNSYIKVWWVAESPNGATVKVGCNHYESNNDTGDSFTSVRLSVQPPGGSELSFVCTNSWKRGDYSDNCGYTGINMVYQHVTSYHTDKSLKSDRVKKQQEDEERRAKEQKEEQQQEATKRDVLKRW